MGTGPRACQVSSGRLEACHLSRFESGHEQGKHRVRHDSERAAPWRGISMVRRRPWVRVPQRASKVLQISGFCCQSRRAGEPLFSTEGHGSPCDLRRSRKSLGVARRLEGSNPSPSAQPGGAPHKGAPLLALRRFRRPQRPVRGSPRASAQIHWLECSLANDWRTNAARIRSRDRAPIGADTELHGRRRRILREKDSPSR